MLLFHPTEERLNRFADGELSTKPRALVARHLLRCERCRGTVSAIRTLGRDAYALPLPPLPDTLRARVLASVYAGEHAIVPIADPTQPAWSGRRVVQVGVAGLLVALVLGVVTRPGELRSDASTLAFDPARPLAGAQVDVVFRPTSRFAGHDRVRLRAHYRRPDDPAHGQGLRREVVTVLARDADGAFRGTLTLPPTVVYGLFAVEDESGQLLEGRGRKGWEFLAVRDRRPSYDALLQKSYEASSGDLRLALRAATEATELDPERVEGWVARSAFEQRAMGSASWDSLRAFHLDQLRRLDSALRHGIVSRDAAASMYFYASTWGETTIAAHWRDRILRDAPRSSAATQLRAVDVLVSQPGDDAQLLEAFERIWSDAPEGKPVFLPQEALRAALRAGDGATARRWADRWLTLEPWARQTIATELITLPSLTPYALTLLAEEATLLRDADDFRRPLYLTVFEHAAESERARRDVLGLMGRVLLRGGHAAAATVYLDSATAEGWNAGFFEDLADARLATGDAAGGVEMLARLAVDPVYSTADVAARALKLVDAATWADEVARARARLVDATLAEATPRPLARVQLADLEGNRRDLRDLVLGQVTIVSFFWPPCVTCLESLEHLKVVRERSPTPVRIVLIAEHPPSAADLARMRARGIDFPVMIDVRGDAARALESWGSAGYFVLDRLGTIQYSHTALEDLSRQVVALGGGTPILF